MDSSKNDNSPLPDGWVLCQSKTVSGRKYYFNKKTGKSSWTRPQATETGKNSVLKKEKSKNGIVEMRNLKRKSDSRQEEVTPKKRVIKVTVAGATPPGKHSLSAPQTPQSAQPPKIATPAKNSANKRLNLFRQQLSDDMNTEHSISDSMNNTNQPSNNGLVNNKSCLNSSENKPNDPRSNCARNNPATTNGNTTVKSPACGDSKCSTSAQSPGSSDSVCSIPSPSQFLAANKILSSMKAQLPEKFSMKSKDTFADIDEAICNQTPEYPSTRHPSTPPQFSVASQIVSAIKSKLSFKSLKTKDFDNVPVEIEKYSSAKQRLEAFREMLRKEAAEKARSKRVDLVNGNARIEAPVVDNAVENMEVDTVEVSRPNPVRTCVSDESKAMDSTNDNVLLVVDTNIFLQELDRVKNILNYHIRGYQEPPTLLVPWRVVSELDRLKDNNANGAVCKRARAAMDYLYQSLPENNRIKGQSLRDANCHIYPCEVPDDEILNCCLQQAERGKSVILISNDKNLCSKAIINGVKCKKLSEINDLVVHRTAEGADPNLEESVRHYKGCIHHLLANILENEMRAKYDTLWEHVLFKAPPWTLIDVLQCLLKHWLAVFSDVFPRIEHLINDLKNALRNIETKGPKNLRKSEVDNFKQLCLEVARRCQIIPDYMGLAKLTVERISRRPEPETEPEIKTGQVSEEMMVIDAFESVWTVLSSYCAKLSRGLGIDSGIEDKMPTDEPLAILAAKWSVYNAQLNDLTDAMKSILNNNDSSDDEFIENVARLEAIFKQNLTLTNFDGNMLSSDRLQLFCSKFRHMLQEAVSKFSQLHELLEVCGTILTKQNYSH